jgi:hypothetical protein
MRASKLNYIPMKRINIIFSQSDKGAFIIYGEGVAPKKGLGEQNFE